MKEFRERRNEESDVSYVVVVRKRIHRHICIKEFEWKETRCTVTESIIRLNYVRISVFWWTQKSVAVNNLKTT